MILFICMYPFMLRVNNFRSLLAWFTAYLLNLQRSTSFYFHSVVFFCSLSALWFIRFLSYQLCVNYLFFPHYSFVFSFRPIFHQDFQMHSWAHPDSQLCKSADISLDDVGCLTRVFSFTRTTCVCQAQCMLHGEYINPKAGQACTSK